MRNKLIDLNNHLFAELERLSDEDLQGEALEKELERAKGITSVSEKIIANAELTYKAVKLQAEYGSDNAGLQLLIGVKE